MCCFPRPGIEPESPALTGGSFPTEPPGKPLFQVLIFSVPQVKSLKWKQYRKWSLLVRETSVSISYGCPRTPEARAPLLNPPVAKKTKHSDKDNWRTRHDGQAWVSQAHWRHNPSICCLSIVLYSPHISGLQTGKAQQCLTERTFPTHTQPSLERGLYVEKLPKWFLFAPQPVWEPRFPPNTIINPIIPPPFIFHLSL